MTHQLPKLYLRLDPNADSFADRDGLVLMMCAANRQRHRGRFTREEAIRILGANRFKAWTTLRPGKERPDLVKLPSGLYYLDGWDEWQEGDLTVRDRVARLRARRRVTGTVTGTVTPPLPEGAGERSTDRIPPSEALGDEREAGTEDPPDPPAADKPLLLDEARCPDCHASGTLRRNTQGTGWFCGTRLGGCNAAFRLDEPAVMEQLGERVKASILERVAREPMPLARGGGGAPHRPTAAEQTLAAVQQVAAEEAARRR